MAITSTVVHSNVLVFYYAGVELHGYRFLILFLERPYSLATVFPGTPAVKRIHRTGFDVTGTQPVSLPSKDRFDKF